MSILRVRRNVTLLREGVDVSIMWLRKDVTLLRERWGHVYTEGT